MRSNNYVKSVTFWLDTCMKHLHFGFIRFTICVKSLLLVYLFRNLASSISKNPFHKMNEHSPSTSRQQWQGQKPSELKLTKDNGEKRLLFWIVLLFLISLSLTAVGVIDNFFIDFIPTKYDKYVYIGGSGVGTLSLLVMVCYGCVKYQCPCCQCKANNDSPRKGSELVSRGTQGLKKEQDQYSSSDSRKPLNQPPREEKDEEDQDEPQHQHQQHKHRQPYQESQHASSTISHRHNGKSSPRQRQPQRPPQLGDRVPSNSGVSCALPQAPSDIVISMDAPVNRAGGLPIIQANYDTNGDNNSNGSMNSQASDYYQVASQRNSHLLTCSKELAKVKRNIQAKDDLECLKFSVVNDWDDADNFVGAICTDLIKLSSQNKSLKASAQQLIDDRKRLESDIDKLQTQKLQAEEKAKQEEEIRVRNEVTTQKNSEMNKMKKDYEFRIAALQNEKEKLQEKNVTLQSDLEIKITKTQELTAKNEYLVTNMSTNSEIIQALKSEKLSLENEKELLIKEKSELKSDLDSSNELNQEKISKKELEISNLKVEIEQLRKEKEKEKEKEVEIVSTVTTRTGDNNENEIKEQDDNKAQNIFSGHGVVVLNSGFKTVQETVKMFSSIRLQEHTNCIKLLRKEHLSWRQKDDEEFKSLWDSSPVGKRKKYEEYAQQRGHFVLFDILQLCFKTMIIRANNIYQPFRLHVCDQIF